MTDTPVVTRFAPSPTGFLHIGGARTALFNWLYARGRGGRFLLRIEDTDRARSTEEATRAILDGMDWLGLDYDGEAISQYSRADRHRAVAADMLASGKAYKCFSSQEEIADFREKARAEGRSTLFQSPWRDMPADQHPDLPFAIRLRAPRDGETIVADVVQGDVITRNALLDDMILIRSDGTPTYMHAVVVDDHDMGVTHVIRGDDHLNNAARQVQVYAAMGWPVPVFAHIPLIHGPDGKKLSKRHGALGIGEYRTMGYPAAALRNYLARLGWSHGDDEVFSTEQALGWFDLDAIGKSPARLDFKKLDYVSSQKIARMDDAMLAAEAQDFSAAVRKIPFSDAQISDLERAMYCLKDRAKSLPDLIDKAQFVLTSRPINSDEKAAKALDPEGRALLEKLTPQLQSVSWKREALEAQVAQVAEAHSVGFGKIAQPLRAALAGRTVTPSVIDMMLVIGREETRVRLTDAAHRD
ncbi:MAG: glutamate--tRNA ligase [Pseudomonadota bacterium]